MPAQHQRLDRQQQGLNPQQGERQPCPNTNWVIDTALHPWVRFKCGWARQRLAGQGASRCLVTLQNQIQVELMKSSISNRPVRSMSAIGNLWNFSVVGPFIAGSVQNDKADLVAMLAGKPDDVVGTEPFQREQVHD